MSTAKERADLSSPLVSGADAAQTPAARSGAGARRFPFLRTKKGIVITVVVVLVIIGGGLAGLAALPKKNKDGSAGGGPEGLDADAVRSDAHFYGESPAVYPSRMLFLADVCFLSRSEGGGGHVFMKPSSCFSASEQLSGRREDALQSSGFLGKTGNSPFRPMLTWLRCSKHDRHRIMGRRVCQGEGTGRQHDLDGKGKAPSI